MTVFLNHWLLSLLLTIVNEAKLTITEQVVSNTIQDKNVTKILKSQLTPENETDDTLDCFYNGTETAEDYVDFTSLHPDRARDLYRIAKTKSSLLEAIATNKNIRRRGWTKNPIYEALYKNPFYVQKAMDLMKQSVYATRLRLRDTRPLRKRLAYQIEYGTAILYGSMMQLRLKMDNLYTTMKRFEPLQTKFMWYLVLYEKCLSFNVDISMMVKEMFLMQTKFHTSLANEQDETDAVPKLGLPDFPPGDTYNP